MACRLDGDKPLSEPVLEYLKWTRENKFQWNSNQNSNIFVQENAFENDVCEMVSILSRPQCVADKAGTTNYILQLIFQIEFWFDKLSNSIMFVESYPAFESLYGK